MSGLPTTLVLDGNQIQLQHCTLYLHVHPMVEQHHVCPESWWIAAGKPVQSPFQTLCPNCHYGVHVCIDGLIAKRDLSLMPPRWVKLAQYGITLALANGLTPAPTL